LAYNRIKDALDRGFKDRMHFVHFEKLTASPAATMAAIYEFLGEERFDHNFEHVEQVTTEDDSVHGFKNLHKIRPKVEPQDPSWPSILGDAAAKYTDASFWKNM
jgi:sulfotransferase